MTQASVASDFETQLEKRVLSGPFRQPRNQHQQTAGSIHNDEVAKPLGFRGGTVAGIIHHEQFPPLFLEAFGPRWFEQGSISIYYTSASTNEERARAFVELPPEGATDAQVPVWMDHENGMRVLEGTASVGEVSERTALRERYENRREPGEVRILAMVPLGKTMPERKVRLSPKEQESRRAVLTEDLDWYWRDSPWGGPIATPVTAFRLLNGALDLRGKIGSAVGLYGAIEVRTLEGPIFVDREYTAQGKLLAVGETPKSEYLWWESTLTDPASGRLVADLIMMNRWMKASSSLYQ